MDRTYFVYMLASRSRTIYIGITRSLKKRIPEHREGRTPGFVTRYRIHRLVYFEAYRDAHAAINREKEIKSWRRERKVALIEERNPTWADLAEAWIEPYPAKKQMPPAKKRPAG